MTAFDEGSVDTKMYVGAYEACWRVHERGTGGTGHYYYVSPSGERFGNKSGALLAAGHQPSAKAPPEPRVARVPAPPPPPATATGERQSARQAARVAAGASRYHEPDDAVEVDQPEDVFPVVRLRFNGRLTTPRCFLTRR